MPCMLNKNKQLLFLLSMIGAAADCVEKKQFTMNVCVNYIILSYCLSNVRSDSTRNVFYY